MRNSSKYITAITALLAGMAVMAACTHQPQEAAPQVSFARDLQPIFAASCAINGSCHLGANSANDQVNLDSSVAYSTITGKGLAVAGNAAASVLYNQVSNGIMPKAPYSSLPAAQVALIKNWIDQGCQNN